VIFIVKWSNLEKCEKDENLRKYAKNEE